MENDASDSDVVSLFDHDHDKKWELFEGWLGQERMSFGQYGMLDELLYQWVRFSIGRPSAPSTLAVIELGLIDRIERIALKYLEIFFKSLTSSKFEEYRALLLGEVTTLYLSSLREGLPGRGLLMRRSAEFLELIPVLQPGGETMADYLAQGLTRARLQLGFERLSKKMEIQLIHREAAINQEKICRSIRLRAERLVAFGRITER